MEIIRETLVIETASEISIHNVTPIIGDIVDKSSIKNGQVLVFSPHTTTALVINENEERLLENIKVYLRKLAPESEKYLHNDLELRKNLPPDEPRNAHSHLMAITLGVSEVIPIIKRKLHLGTWQSILFVELDGPRKRNLFVQIMGK